MMKMFSADHASLEEEQEEEKSHTSTSFSLQLDQVVASTD